MAFVDIRLHDGLSVRRRLTHPPCSTLARIGIATEAHVKTNDGVNLVTDWQTLVALLVVGFSSGCIGIYIARSFLRQNHKLRNLYRDRSADLTEIQPLHQTRRRPDVIHKSGKLKDERKEN